MSNVTEEDIERILKARDADYGLFILAMHSLMERAMKQDINPNWDFAELIREYVKRFENKYGTPVYSGKYIFPNDKYALYKQIKKIEFDHYKANDVRHKFEPFCSHHGEASVTCFLAFAKEEGWDRLSKIRLLEKDLENWKNHQPAKNEELTKAIAEISRLMSENEGLAKKVNELNELQLQMDSISAQERALRAKLAESEAKLTKKDEKLDKVRKDANDQFMKFRAEKAEIQEKIKDYEETKKYISILEKVSFYTKTRHDYEQSIISLSREQKDILEQIKLNKDYLIKGAAGTGKSLVLIKTLEKAVKDLQSELGFEENNNSFRLLTYTKSLVKYNLYVTKLLKTEVPEGAITTADSFLFAMLKKFFPEVMLVYSFDRLPAGVFEDGEIQGKEIYTEAEEFIWANCITREQYIDDVCERDGMKSQIKKTERIKLWDALEKAEKKLENQKFWPRNYAAKKINEVFSKGGDQVAEIMAEYSFIDEAQDLPPAVLALIKNSTKRAVFLAGDSDQSIYRKGFNWNRSGIDIRGRTKILKTNFRNTVQIHEYAEEYRNQFKTKDSTTMPDAFRPGPPVEHITGKNSEDVMNQMVEQIKLLMNALDYEEENICIIANTVKKLEKMQELLEKKLGIEANIIDNEFDFETTQGVRLCTMQTCKGMDFPVVLLLADHRIHNADRVSVYDEETFMTQQFNMVYVALTRAMEMLYVFTVQGSDFEPFKKLK